MGPKRKNQDGDTTQRSRRNWSTNDVEGILTYLLEVKKSGKDIEKPTANVFYGRLLANVPLEDCSSSQVRHQVGNLRKKYQSTVDWRRQTGQGVLEEEGESRLKDLIIKRCPHFDLLDEIFGDRLTVNPPYTLDSSKTDELHEGRNELPGSLESRVESEEDPTDPEVPIIHNNPSHSGPRKDPKSAKRPKTGTTSSSKALSDLLEVRFQVHEAELSFSKDKWLYEKERMDRLDASEKKKFEFEMEMRIKEQSDKMEIEKYKIDQEMKMKLEIAKMQFVQNNSCN